MQNRHSSPEIRARARIHMYARRLLVKKGSALIIHTLFETLRLLCKRDIRIYDIQILCTVYVHTMYCIRARSYVSRM